MTVFACSACAWGADTEITTNATWSGDFTPDDASAIVINDPVNDPLLTINNGAVVSWSGVTIVGAYDGETGHLSLSEGAQLDNDGLGSTPVIGNLYDGDGVIGWESGSSGSALVSGNGTLWSGRTLRVGYEGVGVLAVEDLAVVSTTDGISLGDMSTAQGNLTVTSSATLSTPSILSVGTEGRGTMLVSDGGSVSAGQGIVGLWASSSGEVSLTGADSLWENTELYVGAYGSGNLSILEGAQAVSGITTIGYAGSGTGAILVSGIGSRLETAEDLLVGTGGSATLSIENGGAVSANNTTLNGTVTVMGAGSTLTANHLTVAVAGINLITVNSGGNVSIANQTILGIEAGSRGIIGVTGNNSHVTTQDLTLGDSGEGRVSVTSHGTLVVTNNATVSDISWMRVLANGTLTARSITSAGLITADGTITAADGITLLSGAQIEGGGVINGDLTLESGALFRFDASKTLTVNGSVLLDPTFSIASLLNMDSNVPNGTYTLINSPATDFSVLGIQNWGISYAYDLGSGKSAYFKQGSLQVVVIPEPTTLLLDLLAGVAWLGRRTHWV